MTLTDALAPTAESSPQNLDPIRSPGLPQMVANKIVEAIGDRRILSGQRIFELELAEQLQVSRVPVREALRVLESQGLVKVLTRRGVHVIDLDQRWAMELYDTRAALETVAARRAAETIRQRPEAAAKLDAALATIERAAELEDRAAINRADLAFHSAIYDLAEAPLVKTLWAAMARHVLIMFGITTHRRTDFGLISREHRQLRDILTTGTAEEITREVTSHIIRPHRSREAAEMSWGGETPGLPQA